MDNGHDLLIFMCQKLGVEEYQEFFGLTYCDRRNGRMKLLEECEKLKKLAFAVGKKTTLQIIATFHPENPEETFETPASRRLFCDLMKDELVRGDLGCDVNTHAYLDAMYLQAALGKYSTISPPHLHALYHFRIMFRVNYPEKPLYINERRELLDQRNQ